MLFAVSSKLTSRYNCRKATYPIRTQQRDEGGRWIKMMRSWFGRIVTDLGLP